MILDIHTFWLVAAMGAASIGAVILLARKAYPPRMHRMLILYGAGMISLGLCLLIRAERAYASEFLFNVVTYMLSTACMSLQYSALCRLKNRRPWTVLLWLPLAVVFLIAIWFVCIHRNLSYEILAINWVNFAMLGLLAWTLWLPEQNYRLPLADILSACGCGLYALVNGMVIVNTIQLGKFPAEYNFNQPRTIINTIAVLITEFVMFPLFLLMLSERVNRILSEQAMQDPLTNLYNRRAFEMIAYREIAGAARTGAAISVLVCDLDHFKQVNDRFGHAAGDQTLMEAAAQLRMSLRNEDFLCRWGGDEFCALLPRALTGDAEKIAERIRQNFDAAQSTAKNVAPHITISIGIATCESGNADLDALLKAADQALYLAKNAGRNRLSSNVQPSGSAQGQTAGN